MFVSSIVTCAYFHLENVLVSLIHTNTLEEPFKNLIDSDMHCITSQVHSTCHYKSISGNTEVHTNNTTFTQSDLFSLMHSHSLAVDSDTSLITGTCVIQGVLHPGRRVAAQTRSANDKKNRLEEVWSGG